MRLRKRLPATVLGLCILLATEPARAVLGVGDTAVVADPIAYEFLSQQVALLTKSTATEILNYGQVGQMVATITSVLKTANELAGYTRFVVNVVNAIRNYDITQLRRDAMAGLSQAYPELANVVSDVDLALKNKHSLEEGPAAFINMRDYRDDRTQAGLAEIADAQLRSNVYSRLFPDQFKKNAAAGVSEADKLVLAKFMRTGLLGRAAAQASAAAGKSEILKRLADDAAASKRQDLIDDAEQLNISQGIYDTLKQQELRQVADTAEAENARQAQQDANSAVVRSLQNAIQAGQFSRPGSLDDAHTEAP